MKKRTMISLAILCILVMNIASTVLAADIIGYGTVVVEGVTHSIDHRSNESVSKISNYSYAVVSNFSGVNSNYGEGMTIYVRDVTHGQYLTVSRTITPYTATVDINYQSGTVESLQTRDYCLYARTTGYPRSPETLSARLVP